MDTTLRYMKDSTYELVVDAGNLGQVVASVKAPSIDSVVIDEPMADTNIPKDTPLPVKWHYLGGTNDGVVGVSFAYDDSDTGYFSGFLAGGTTQHTVPGEYLNRDGNASVSVFAGNYKKLDGLLSPPPDTLLGLPGLGYSLFGAFVSSYVDVVVGQGSSLGGNWMGILWGQVNGQHVDSLNSVWQWMSSNSNYQGQLTWGQNNQELFGGVVSFPPSNAKVLGNLGDTSILNTLEVLSGDTIHGTWELKGPNTGSGEWGGIRFQR
jgi:hypothetical protein